MTEYGPSPVGARVMDRLDHRGKMVVRGPAMTSPISRRSTGAFVDTPGQEAPYRGLGQYRGLNAVWWPTGAAATPEIIANRSLATRAARDLDRNYPLIHEGISRKVNSVVGANLRAQFTPMIDILGWTPEEGRAYADDMEGAFRLWANDPRLLNDAKRHYQFGAQVWMAYRNMTGPEGEVLMIIRTDEERMIRYGSPFATFVEVVDPDRLSTPPELVDSTRLRAGRQLDEWGAVEGLWIQVRHPNDTVSDPLEPRWEYVPRETDWGRPVGVHWFICERGDQQRAITTLVRSLRNIKMLDKFDDAQLQAAIVDAVLSVHVKSDMDPKDIGQLLAPAGGEELNNAMKFWEWKFDYYDENKLVVGPNVVPVLPPGDELMLNTSSRATGNTDSFRAAFNRGIAANLGISPQQLDLNLADVNYSSIRYGAQEIWRGFYVDRHMFCQHAVAQITSAVGEEALVRGMVRVPRRAPDFDLFRTAYLAATFTGPGQGNVDPLKEAKAGTERLTNETRSLADECAEDGSDYREVQQQIEREAMERADREARVVKHRRSLGLPDYPPAPGASPPEPPAEEEEEETPASRGADQ